MSQNPVFIPGPTNIPERIRKACDIATVDHRSAKFGRILGPALAGVKEILRTEAGEVIVFPATGTAGWEAAIQNTLSPGDRVLAARHGMFSQRWIEMCQRHGLDVQVVETPWSEGCPAEAFEAILAEDRAGAIKAVLVTHNETATGVTSDVAAVRRALDRTGHGALLFVDGVSSIASIDFRMDDWGVDIAVTGSQKGFMLPPGLAILGISPKAIRAMATARLTRTFLDFGDMRAAYAKGSYPYTPSVGLLNGLAEACGMILDEGLEAVFARHARIAEGVRRAVFAWGMRPCAARPELWSNTVTAVVVPEGFDGNAVVRIAAERYDVPLGAGLGDVAGKVFRLGHLGMLTEVLMLAGIATAEMAMADAGIPVTLGSGVAAAQAFYRGEAGAAARAAA